MPFKTRERRVEIFTWHIHGTYLYYLSQGNFNIYIPVNSKRNEGYYGRGATFPFGDNVIEIPAEEVRNCKFDCILYQASRNFLVDQYEILSEEQKVLPRIYLEHDPPRQHPVNDTHIMNDPDVLVVHVTHYNRLMWHNTTPLVRVIEHGVPATGVLYKGNHEKGIVVINNLFERGRLLGSDIFRKVSKIIPLDLVGMGTVEHGGLGEVLHPELPAFVSDYRFFFNPIRYTSMGLAVCEAMMAGLPVVALGTTEYPAVIKDGISGFISNDVDHLIEQMKLLLKDRELARQLGAEAKKTAEEKFNIQRFVSEWEETFRWICNTHDYEKKNSSYQ